MNLRDLQEWVAHCRNQSVRARSDAIVGGGWMLSMSTPPPSLSDPLERIPLERAQELREAAAIEARPEARALLFKQALDWLAHPYPDTTPFVQRLLRDEAMRIKTEMLERGGAHLPS